MSVPDSPVRPERSSRRTSAAPSTEGHHTNAANGGIAGAAANGLTGLGNAATGAYNRAPDLGISSTANSAYQRAPDLGVSSTINAYSGGRQQGGGGGGGGGGSGAGDDDVDDERVIRPKDNSDQDASTSESRREESQRVGPSDKSRIGKTQQEIGTETGIPTAAGAGTTASADQTNMKALEKAESQGKVHEAHVPEDYEAQPCPIENAGSGKSKNVAYEGGKTSSSRNSSSSSSAHNNNENFRGSTSHTHQSSDKRSSSQRGGHTVTTSDGNEYEVEKRRSFGEKIKDQVKGEIKILAGTVTGSDEKVMRGLAIKHGEHN